MINEKLSKLSKKRSKDRQCFIRTSDPVVNDIDGVLLDTQNDNRSIERTSVDMGSHYAKELTTGSRAFLVSTRGGYDMPFAFGVSFWQ